MCVGEESAPKSVIGADLDADPQFSCRSQGDILGSVSGVAEKCNLSASAILYGPDVASKVDPRSDIRCLTLFEPYNAEPTHSSSS